MRIIIFFLFLSTSAYGQFSSEILDFNTSKLNKTIPSALTKQQLISRLGKPTKVENFSTECALIEEKEQAKVKQLYFYGHTQFFIYDNQAELTIIDFRSGSYTYQTAKILLTSATTLADVQKVYPKSVQASLKENGGKQVWLKPCKDCDGQCRLYFEKGKLVKLEWWQDC